MRLNRRLAPAVYLGVVPVSRRDEAVQVGGDGEVVEWAVKMTRLPDDATLEGSDSKAGAVATRCHVLTRRPADRRNAHATDREKEMPAANRRQAVIAGMAVAAIIGHLVLRCTPGGSGDAFGLPLYDLPWSSPWHWAARLSS